ncbi:MAG: hypothetical protein ACFUZC_10515 [Chthoniobacteraceae bacterium]
MIWFDSDPDSNPHENILAMQKATQERANELGYSLDEFRRNDYTPKALHSILKSRGIRGLLISPPVDVPGKTHLQIEMTEFAAVSLGWAILHPALDSVRFDHYSSVQTAIHHARHQFGGRIAGLWNFEADRRADHICRAAFLTHHPSGPAVANKLFLNLKHLHPTRTKALFQQHQIECLICDTEEVPSWVYRLVRPEKCIYMFRPPLKSCLGWVDPRYDLLGKTGIDILTSILQRGEYGISETPKTTQIPGSWRSQEPM